jgi:glutamine cyclotransferase
MGVACGEKPEPEKPALELADPIPVPEWKAHEWSGYEVVKELPHDPGAFTQGLLLSDGEWIESTGGYGTTSIRRVEKATGKVLMENEPGKDFFGEGLAEFDGKFFQLTWENQQGFVYDAKTLQRLGIFKYGGEGWGLTADGQSLIMSNGSDRLQFIDPRTFRVWREVSVRLNGKPVNMLNELEFVEGEVFANVWHTDKILRINPADGTVVGVIDLAGIDAKEKRRDPEHVLNGIAYDPVLRELFVTGKCWPKIYQIRLVMRK